MNEIMKHEFEILIDNVHPDDRHLVARLMDLITEYEHGDFAHGWSDFLPELLERNRTSPNAMVALFHVFHYANELVRVEVEKLPGHQQVTSHETETGNDG